MSFKLALVLACFIFIDTQAVPARCPKKCGKVRKLVNNVIECGCGSLEPAYGVLAEIPKCGCGKVCLDAAMDICGCKIPNIDTQIVGILDYITGIVESKCGCGVTPSGCQVTPCGCPVTPCGCQVTPCGCPVTPCGCQVAPCSCQVTPCGCHVAPCGCQKTVTIANNYDVLPTIEIPRCAPVVKMAHTAPAIETCGKCSQIDCNCRNIPYEVIAVNGCGGPIMEVPAYVYSIQGPVVEVLPFECGCGMGTCGCGMGLCGCGLGKCTCGLQVEPCNCGVTKYACVDCGVGPCVCSTGSCGCGVPNCGCVSVCGCGIPECSCVNPCGVTGCSCGLTNCGCGVTNCGCVGPCGCDVNSGCCCRKRLRKTSIPPPFL